MVSFRTATALVVALLFGAAAALPQPQEPGVPAVCPDGSGPYTKAGTTKAVCTPCASINRSAGSAGSGTCGGCNVANSALDSASGACLCGATDKGRIDSGTTCAPCGVNGFSNGDRITCSPCIVGAAPRVDTDGETRCHCNTDKGYHLTSTTSTAKKCLMCISLGRKNWSARSTSPYGEECGACIDPSKVMNAVGACVFANTLVNGNFEAGSGSPPPPWTISGGSFTQIYNPGRESTKSFGFGASGVSRLCQVLPGTVGVGTHTLSLWAFTDDRNVPREGSLTVSVSVGGTQVYSSPEQKDVVPSGTRAAAGPFAQLTFSVPIATAGTATVCINAFNPPNWFYVDDITFA